jgi:type I restriction enzyme S subunit
MSKGKQLIPELRFPEFVNDGNWGEKTLIDVTDKKVKWSFTGGPFGSNLKASDYTSDGIRIIQLQNIGDGDFLDEYKIFTSEEKADELLSCNIYSNEIILSKMGDPVGRACIVPDFLDRCVMASDGIRLVVDEKKYSKYFVFSLINSNQIRKSIEKKATGSTRKRIGLDELKAIQLTIPKFKEQQKIASCLSSLDEVISTYSQKLKLLKDHKKGLMQNLFPQEREKVPKYQFSKQNGKWKKTKLNKHIDLVSGFAFQSEFFSKEGRKLITPKNFTREGYANFNEDNTKYTTEKFDTKYFCYEGDLLLLLTDLTPSCELLGKPVMLKKGNGVVLLNQRIVKVVSKTDLNKQFLLQFFLTNLFHKRIVSTATGSTVRHSSNKIILDTELLIPDNPMEQQKIASCLSSLDELITAHAEKIEQLKLHKKGLMQGLFPKTID